MVDHVTKARRSAMMSGIRGKHTAPEMIIRSAAHRMGLRFRLHGKLPGRPDLVFSKWKTVVFVNGCFWHRHEGCKRTTVPKSNTAFWNEKFDTNVRRDRSNYQRLAALGWRVVVLWQCEISSPETAAERLRRHFRKRRKV
jgi:DNA mismatch endonuclease, patch repair protein